MSSKTRTTDQSTTTADEIADLRARLEQLEFERDTAVRDAEAARGQKMTATAFSLAPLMSPIARAAAERETAEARRQAHAIATTLPKLGKLLDESLRTLEEACRDPNLRAGLHAEIDRAYRAAIGAWTRGEPACVDLEELVARYQRAADPPPPRFQPPALVPDTPIYARRSFEFRDLGEPNVFKRTIGAGAICLLPAEVAEAAAAKGLAERLPPPAGIRLRILTTTRLAEDLVFAAGAETLVEPDAAAELLARYAAEPLTALLPSEVKAYRAGRPELVPTGAIDLGTFNRGADAPAPEAAAA